MRHVLFAAGELQAGVPRSVMVGHLPVLVVQATDGRLHAYMDRCPHRGAPLSVTPLEPLLEGDEVGEYVETGDEIIRCPWHGYEFSVRTGRCIADPQRVGIRPFDVSVVDGMVVIDHGAAVSPA